ncbi:TonB-dependent receptor domain-containing protein [Phenylobacterium sp. VNQ135]|uniref:TonB-dependent receptor domain-containing protein n=1 Tax=Phenylobacterium sp. VNQ135 TaxID=3400922 RepID=UPI003C0EDEE0
MKGIYWLATCSAVALLSATAAAAQEAAQPADVGEVVVTGSRIARKDYAADSPVVTLSEQALEISGPASVEQTLNQLPQFGALQGTTTASPAKQGRSSANLRGLGPTRTLVLMDGRRMQPSDAQGTIDLNTIASSLIGGVEIITGGASAVYGSDAIAGVVNLKLKTDFEGLVLDAQYGESHRADGDTYDLSAAFGGDFDDGRGHAVVSLSYFNREEIYGRSRDFFAATGIAGQLRGGVVQAEASNLPSQAALNSVFVGRYGSTTSPLRNQAIGVNRDNTLFTSTAPILNLRYEDHDPYIVDQGQRVGFPLAETYFLQSPLERYSVFGRADYEISDSITAYAQVNLTDYKSQWTRNGDTATSATATAFIPITNPFIPADLRTILASRPNPNAPINFAFNTGGVGPRVNYQSYDVRQYMLGLKGEAWGDWTWDLYATYGKTKLDEIQDGYIDRAAWSTLVNAADGGRSVCEGGYNPFNPDPLILNPAKRGCYDYLNRTLKENTSFEQQVVEGTAQGALFTLPAGDVRAAIGGSYRRNAYRFLPDTARTFRTVYPDQSTGPTGGSLDVYEAFAELLIPVVRDLPFAKEVNLDVAYRFSDYSTVGGVHTYKGSVDWNIVGALRFRGGYQRAIRAPNLAELYAPPERSLPQIGSVAGGAGDFCDANSRLRTGANAAQVRALCLAQGVPATVIDLFRFSGSAVPAVTAGNTDLKEETADTYTAGLVWRSRSDHPLLSGLSASVDYYDISVKDAIGQITTALSFQRCFNADGRSNPTYAASNYFCSLITRNATTGAVEQALQPTLNLGAYKTSGVDVQVDYRVALEDLGLGDRGDLSANLVVSHLRSFKIQNLEGQPFVDYAGTIGNTQVDPNTVSFPEWKVFASLTWDGGPFAATLRARFYDKMENYQNVGVANGTLPGVKSRQYFDLAGRYEFDDKTEFRAGVLNLFDTVPPAYVQGAVPDPALYDVLGRRYYVGVNKRF